MRDTRPISWLKGARKDFDGFPTEVQRDALRALTVAAEGRMAAVAKPLKGFGGGVFEIVLRFKGGAYRVIYSLQLAAAVWVIHAFQKKSKRSAETPKTEIRLIGERIKRLKEM